MSTPDQSTNITLPSGNDLTGLAVAMGRIEQNQINMKDTVDRIDTSVSGLVDTVSSHNARLAVLESNQKSRVAWYVYATGIGSVAAIVVSVYELLH